MKYAEAMNRANMNTPNTSLSSDARCNTPCRFDIGLVRAAGQVVGKRKGALREWVVALLARRPARLVTVALANKLARIIWAIMTTGSCQR